ncbi:NosD domain-containing protein [Haloarculaceae archaeon H-GB2-1]|nr:right-handed parallel beta-helix repeat-containing protein [Haloarculaceae archaeon H-GB1-1]MEA5387050.1 NosD domain-containing protein [Haloarculaceae archaeon H-GB11]MEA5408552.1 NosD domain-containing protein [Haloarculaceae archaeon H-GB2-1]
MLVKYVLVALLTVLAVLGGSFLVQPGSDARLSPVRFDDTLQMGLSSETVREAEAADAVIPRAEVFYSQYRYVVGYEGLETLASELGRVGHERQFGRPLAIFVTDYSNADPYVDDDGLLRVNSSFDVRWTNASKASFVVDSGARTPAGPTPVPFESQASAREFAARYGGDVVGWAELRRRLTERPGVRETSRAAVANRSQWANRTVAATSAYDDRPVSVVVGEDAPTLSAAVERAPANTTVVLPPGTYDGNVTVEKPLTIRGSGPETTIRGPGNGTVLRLSAQRIAVRSLAIDGVGPNGTAPLAERESLTGWDAKIRAVYGSGDAAILADGANRSLVSNVRITTPASGVIVRSSDEVVVANVTIDGTERWQDGFMNVLAIRSRIVVQDSTIRGGRDGVYTHRAHGLVVRRTEMRDLRFGVHEMYTSDALVRNNTVRDADVGLIVMTRPTGNALVGNDVRASDGGLSVVGSDSYVAQNVVAGNDLGIDVATRRSLYERNTVVGNDVGLRAGTLLPTNWVVANDVVGNDRPVTTGRGPTRVWTATDADASGEDRRGNYWGDLPALDRDGDGTIDRAYRPTGAVDGRLGGRGPGATSAATLARSPTVSLLREFETVVPGLRAGGVVDTDPLAEPVRPAVVDSLTEREHA